MTIKWASVLIVVAVFVRGALLGSGCLEQLRVATPANQTSSNIKGAGQRTGSISVTQEPEEFMKQRTNKLTPLLAPGFPHGSVQNGKSAEGIQPNDLFPIWRKLPQFSTWDDLTLASMLGDLQKVRDLLAQGADPSGHSGSGTSPLIEALSHDHRDVAALLLDKMTDASQRTPSGWTALHLAASNGWADLARQLLSRGAGIDSTTREGWTALILAAMRGHADVVKLLLDRDADPEIHDVQGATALLYAATGGQEESGGDYDCLSALVEHGANVNAQDARGWAPLMGAAFYGDIRSVHLLVEYGAQIDAKNENGETARSLAEGNKQLNVAEFLAGTKGHQE